MATVKCSISGLEFKTDHLSFSVCSQELAHPVFYLTQRQLEPLYVRYCNEESFPTKDAYLLFLAFLNSTGLVEWRTPAGFYEETEAIVANNFQFLVTTIQRMNTIRTPSVQFAKVSVSNESRYLKNVAYWITSWEETCDDYFAGGKREASKRELHEMEARLDYIIKDANRKETTLAANIAAWANKAASFPKTPIRVGSEIMPKGKFWESIIRKCVNEESVFCVENSDLQELLDYCMENLELGSLYTYNLVQIIKRGMGAKEDLLGMGDFEYQILDQESVEQANLAVIIGNAGEREPSRKSFPSTFAYIKAKMAWDQKKEKEESERQQQALDNSTGEL